VVAQRQMLYRRLARIAVAQDQQPDEGCALRQDLAAQERRGCACRSACSAARIASREGGILQEPFPAEQNRIVGRLQARGPGHGS
jgi:hypothetical protein